jgi:DNA-binding NarL/FixJ family response regulator
VRLASPVLAEAADGEQAVAATLKYRPDVVLMDIPMPQMDGLEGVLRLLVRGLSNAELATQPTLSEATVMTHLARILAKLQLRDRVQAVVLAYETGLAGPAAAEPADPG